MSTLLILGASGDLTKRLLLPGLGTLLAHEPNRDVTVIGASNETLSDDQWRSELRTALTAGGLADARVTQMADASTFVTLDLLDPGALSSLVADLPADSVLYFALPPAITLKVCELLKDIRLPSGVRFGLEKPFGNDLASARQLNDLLHRIVPERQIFRVDHFLGKSAVLNLLGFRFANRVLEPVWNATNIARVAIVFDETLALEGRAGYYDKSGAMRDMIQSHLLLILALFAMESPSRIDAVELRDLVTQVLRATSLTGDARRARYVAGEIDGKAVPNYVDEPGVKPENNTETLAEFTVEIANSRWAGVPFVLRSGKALGLARRQIIVTFRPVAHLPSGLHGDPGPNRLIIDMNPEELTMQISTNGADDKFELERINLTAPIGESAVLPYGEVLAHILDGDPLLSVRADTTEELWRIVTPVIEAYRSGAVPMETYPAGSRGPWPVST